MSRLSTTLRLLAATGAVALMLSACGGSSSSNNASSSGSDKATPAGNSNAPSWCGPKKISLGLTDGFGGNSWRLVTTAAAKDEVAKCPSVTSFTYADGQGNTQKAISDIQGLVAKGVNALVVFPDAGNAVLPALRSAHQAGVTTVPYRVDPGGSDGTDYDVWVGADFTTDGKNWGNWILKNLPDGGNVLFISGPKGNSQGITEGKALHSVLDPSGKYKFIGEQPFAVTNWDPALTQQVLTAAIAKNPKIDVIVSDFGPSLVGALPAFEKSGRSIPAIVTSDGNVLSCFYEDHKAKNKDFKLTTVATGNDNARLAVDWAVAIATGGTKPASKTFQAPIFEDSVSGQPHPVTCDRNLPGDVYLSAQMAGPDQAKLLK
ncbi:MAG: ribose transport system substrate-binding protein [Actinomycetota bacterium]|jgi:ribose transport system substrate-binding protein|nr:ribose transport system substrate-binding protein [Actinomycetota bacterium]